MSDVYKELEKRGILQRGDAEGLELERMPFGIPPIDQAIGGGIPVGGVTLLVGLESSGKTLMAQYAARSNQERERDHVLYLDMEHSYDRAWWIKSGVDPKRVFVARPYTGEDMIDLVSQAMSEDDRLGLVIIDSIAASPPEVMTTNDASRDTIGQLARMMTKFFAKILPLTNGQISVVMINQLRMNIGRVGYNYPGGMAQRFYAHMILRVIRTGWISEGNDRIGYTLEISVEKNKTAPPQRHVSVPFKFEGQIDLLASTIERAVEAGIIERRAAYYRVPDENGEIKSVMGMKNLRDHINAIDGLYEQLREQLDGE